MKASVMVWLAALAGVLALSAGSAQAQCRHGGSMNMMRQSMLQTPFMGAQLYGMQSPYAVAQMTAMQQQALALAQLNALQQQYALQAQLLALQQNPTLQAQLAGLQVNPQQLGAVGQNAVNAPAARSNAPRVRTAQTTTTSRRPRPTQNLGGN